MNRVSPGVRTRPLNTDPPAPPTPTPLPDGGLDDSAFCRFIDRIMDDARQRAAGDPPIAPENAPAAGPGPRLLRCRVCGRAGPRLPEELSRLAAAGWPACCGESLSGAAAPPPTLDPDLERRRRPRRAARPWAKAELRLGQTDLGPDLGLALLDVSEDGARIRLRLTVQPGDAAEVVLWPPGETAPVRRRARVVWCRPGIQGSFLAGVRLAEPLTAEELNALAY
jgi:PilZ domain